MTTLDGLLDRRVALEQPVEGYRVAVDTVFLAAAVPAVKGDHVLDIGCGVGGAMLCLAARVAGVTGVGLEIQDDLAELCRRNIARNDFAAGLTIQGGDVAQMPPAFNNKFDHVLMNPPYHEEARHDVSDDRIKRTANSEKDGDLALWIAAAARALKTSGTLTIIHRADRQREIMGHLRGVFGEIEVLPLVPKEGAEAKRIIVRARKDAVQFMRKCKVLVLHKTQGGYGDEAEVVLRGAQPLLFQSP